MKKIKLIMLCLVLAWNATAQRHFMTNRGHHGDVIAADASADGKWLITAARDQTVRLWSYPEKKLYRVFTIYDISRVKAIAISPKAKYIAVSFDNKRVRVWERKTGKLLFKLRYKSQRVNHIDFSHDGKTLAGGLAGGGVICWSMQNGQTQDLLSAHTQTVIKVIYARNGKQLVSLDDAGEIFLWDLQRKKVIRKINVGKNKEQVSNIALSRDGATLVALRSKWASSQGLDVWNLKTGKMVVSQRLEGKGFTDALAMNPAGKEVAVASEKGGVVLWGYNGTALTELKRYKTRYEANTLLYMPQEPALVMGMRWNRLKIIDPSNGRQLFRIGIDRASMKRIAFAKGKLLINKEGQPVLVWNGKQFIKLKRSKDHTVYLSPDAKTSVGSGYFRAYTVWDNATGEIVKQPKNRTRGHKNITLSPKGTYYAVSTSSRRVRIYRRDSLDFDKPFRVIKSQKVGRHFMFSPDEKHMVITGGNPFIEIWDIETNKLVKSLRGHSSSTTVATYDHTGKYLLSGDVASSVVVWDVAKGKYLRTFKGHKGSITYLSYSAQDRYILSGDVSGILRLWNGQDYKFIRNLTGHQGAIVSAEFIDNNTKIISTDESGEVIIWDVETGLRLLSLWTLNKGRDYIAYTPDGRFDGTSGGIRGTYEVRNDSVFRLKPNGASREKDLLEKTLKSKSSENVVNAKSFAYVNIVLTNPDEPKATIARETNINYNKESLIIKGRLQNIESKEVIKVQIDGQRATFNRNDLSFSSRRISFLDSPNKAIAIEVFTRDGNVTARLLRVSATLNNISQKPALVVTKGHRKDVTAIDFHPKGRFYATASKDLSIKVWDRSLGQEFRTLTGHREEISKIAFSPNGKYLMSMDRNEVILWKHPSGQIIKRIKSHYGTALFTSDSKRLLLQAVTPASGFTGNLLVVSTSTGERIKEYYDFNLGANASLHQGNQWLFSGGKRLNLIAGKDEGYFEYKDGSKMFAWTMSAVSNTHFVAYDVVKQAINVWALANPKDAILSIPFSMSKGIKKIELTPDGKQLVVGTFMYKLFVYKIPSGKFVREIKLKKGVISQDRKFSEKRSTRELGILYDFSISPDGRVLGVNSQLITSGREGNNFAAYSTLGVRFISLKKGKDLGVFGGVYEGLTDFAVTPNEKYMVSSHFGKSPGIRLWNLRKGQVDGFVPIDGLSHNNARHTVAFDRIKKAIKLYKLPDFKEVMNMPTTHLLQQIYLSPNSQRMIYTAIEGKTNTPNIELFLYIWDISNLKAPKLLRKVKVRETTGSKRVIDDFRVSPDNKYLLTRGNERKNKESTFSIECVEIATGKKLMSYDMDYFYDHILDFVPNKKRVLISRVAFEENNYKTQLVELDYTTGKEMLKVDTDYEIIFSANFSPDGQYLVTGSGGYWLPQNIFFDVAVWDWNTKNINCVLTGHTNNVKQVWFGEKGKKVYSADDNSIIKVWDIRKCKLAGSFLGLGKDDYIILNADNYYKTSKGNITSIGFRYKGKLRAFGQFDLRFNRPDLVMKDLGASKIVQRIYYKAWKKRLRRAGVTEAMIAGDMNLPEVAIVNKFDLPSTTNTPNIKVQIRANDGREALKNLQVYVNDVPLYDKNGLSARGKQVFEQRINVKLNQGLNKVAVSAMNKSGLESAKETFNVFYKPAKQKAKPKLYVLAIGVSKYEDKERNLKFAEKDANDLLKVFANGKTANYDSVIVRKVLNEKATKANILKAAKVFKKSNVDDQIMIYVSCHGLLDDKMDYYLATHNVDFNNPSQRGLPYEAIEQMLDNVPARRRLIMIDACHSGELDKSEIEVTKAPDTPKEKKKKVTIAFKGGKTFIKPKAGLNNSFDYMKALFNDVSNRSGATIISAAAGYEFALESKEWNNGVFTYSIMQGLDLSEENTDNADYNNDGKVTISELKEFVIGKVTELTDGKQVPTTRRENQSLDVVLYKPKQK
jgi:WD40 repeat protein